MSVQVKTEVLEQNHVGFARNSAENMSCYDLLPKLCENKHLLLIFGISRKHIISTSDYRAVAIGCQTLRIHYRCPAFNSIGFALFKRIGL